MKIIHTEARTYSLDLCEGYNCSDLQFVFETFLAHIEKEAKQ